MTQTTFAMSFVALGVAAWVASRFAHTEPAFAMIVVAAVLIFGSLKGGR